MAKKLDFKNKVIVIYYVLILAIAGPYSVIGIAKEVSTNQNKKIHAIKAENQLIKRGVKVDFELTPTKNDKTEVMEGDLVNVRFSLTGESSGEPVKGVAPGAWMDIGQVIQSRVGGQQKSCKDKIALYLQGVVGIRPMIDLNSYYILVMNSEPSISVVDPLVSMVGQTSTMTTIPLKGTASDWVKSKDDKRLYVSMPEKDMVALIDADTFKVVANIKAGARPTRVVIQPDGRYLWIGNDAANEKYSGVTIVDNETNKAVKSIATGKGHHEISFPENSKYAFVSNRDAGTITVIDTQTLKIVKNIATGPLPISMDYSPLAGTLLVADGKKGNLTVIDVNSLKIVSRITIKPGLGPIKFSQDGRWALVVNPIAEKAYIIDAADNKHIHTIDVQGKPYQISFSRAFAYVRALESERVTMINLSSIGAGKQPIVQGFSAGSKAPVLAGNLPLATSMTSATTEAALFVVNPTDNTTYFYMEGMNATSSNYKVRGSRARAVILIDRSLREVKPGVYEAKVKIPAAGRYDIAFQLETPRILHCFTATAKADPNKVVNKLAFSVKYLSKKRAIYSGDTVPFRFKLTNNKDGKPKVGVKDVTVLYYRAPGAYRREVTAKEKGEGVYEVQLPISAAGAYYFYVGSRSERVKYNDLPYYTLIANRSKKRSKIQSFLQEETKLVSTLDH